tara:strand:- start:609 stop:770 length:162 start_codon:yes stop_codon:yes gene_type:complete
MKPNNHLTTTVATRVTVEEMKQLKKKASMNKQTISYYLRTLLITELEKEEGNI